MKQFNRMFDETNLNWHRDPKVNYLFLKGVQRHMNNLLGIRGHVLINDVYDALGFERTGAGCIYGWHFGYKIEVPQVDFGIFESTRKSSIRFLDGETAEVKLRFNPQGIIIGHI